MPFEFLSNSKFKAKSSGTLWTCCKQYFQLFIVSLKLLFQSAGLLQNIMHFENPLILRLFPEQMIPFILVDKKIHVMLNQL